MTSQTEKAKLKLATLSTSLDDLEAHLEPLFAQTLPETVLGLEPIQQAKLQTVLPYLVYDLIFIYLKSRGIDPKTHSVVQELDRVKQYFDKIANAENSPTKRTEIDKAAAGRFIKHAIAQATSAKQQSEASAPTIPEPSTSSSVRVPVVTAKMLERQQYEKELKEQYEAEGEEKELAVFGGDDDVVMDTDPSRRLSTSKRKEKEAASVIQEPTQYGNKRRRPAVDPFAGYGGDPQKTSAVPTEESRSNEISSEAPPHDLGTPALTKERKVKRSKKRAHDAVDTPTRGSLPNFPVSNADSSNQGPPVPATIDGKKVKKVKKKARKSSTPST